MPRRQPDSIRLEGDHIVAESSGRPLRLPVSAVRVFGESTNEDGPFKDDYFLIFVTDVERWTEVSFYASGRDAFLDEFGKTLNSTLHLRLQASTDFDSNVLWPEVLAGEALFRFTAAPRRGLLGRIVDMVTTGRVQQSLSPPVVDYIQRNTP